MAAQGGYVGRKKRQGDKVEEIGLTIYLNGMLSIDIYVYMCVMCVYKQMANDI